MHLLNAHIYFFLEASKPLKTVTKYLSDSFGVLTHLSLAEHQEDVLVQWLQNFRPTLISLVELTDAAL